MIRVLYISVLLISLGLSDHVRWEGSYESALQRAHQEDKPLMVLLIKKECHLCQEVIKSSFMNHKGISLINQKVVPVIVIDGQREAYPIELYYSMRYPALFFVSSKTECFVRDPLYKDGIKPEIVHEIIKGI